jgi:acetyl esterase/lipase
MKNLMLISVLLITLSGCEKTETIVTPITPIPPQEKVDITSGNPVFDVKKNIAYGSNSYQKYDLYLPDTRNTQNPVIVLLHGGAWQLGDKSNLDFLTEELKTKHVNCAIVNINYRLATAGSGISYPQQLEDIDILIKHIASQSKNLGISAKFFLIGMSSGGHLGMMYAQIADSNHAIMGVGCVAPPVDLTTQKIREGIIGNELKQMIGKPYAENPDAYKQASPVFRYANPTVPTIVFFGGKDLIVTTDQSDACKIIINNEVKTNEHYFYPEQSHEWSAWSETLDLMVKFIGKRL